MAKKAIKSDKAVKPSKSDAFGDSLAAGIKYPWNNAKRLFNILWVLIPIIGWFALMGYIKAIVQELVKGNVSGLPAFGSFWDNLKEGFMVFIYMIPTMVILYVLMLIPIVGGLVGVFVELFILPWLIINFYVKSDFNALWELNKCFDKVFKNIETYLIALAKTMIYMVIYGLLSIILIGIPGYAFGSLYFMAEFYNKYH